MSATRKVGYLLLVLGFGMIVTRLLLQQLDREAFARRVTTEVMDALGDPNRYKTTAEVQAEVYHVTLWHATRVTASLIPGCLMLAGGLLLAIRRRRVAKEVPSPGASGASGAAPHEDSGIGKPSWVQPIPWLPEPGSSYRKTLLSLARRTIELSPFFRDRRSDAHVDPTNPGCALRIGKEDDHRS